MMSRSADDSVRLYCLVPAGHELFDNWDVPTNDCKVVDLVVKDDVVSPASAEGGISLYRDLQDIEALYAQSPNFRVLFCLTTHITAPLHLIPESTNPDHIFLGPSSPMTRAAFEEALSFLASHFFPLEIRGRAQDISDGEDHQRASKTIHLVHHALLRSFLHHATLDRPDRLDICMTCLYHGKRVLADPSHYQTLLIHAPFRLRDRLSKSLYHYADELVASEPMAALLLVAAAGRILASGVVSVLSVYRHAFPGADRCTSESVYKMCMSVQEDRRRSGEYVVNMKKGDRFEARDLLHGMELLSSGSRFESLEQFVRVMPEYDTEQSEEEDEGGRRRASTEDPLEGAPASPRGSTTTALPAAASSPSSSSSTPSRSVLSSPSVDFSINVVHDAERVNATRTWTQSAHGFLSDHRSTAMSLLDRLNNLPESDLKTDDQARLRIIKVEFGRHISGVEVVHSTLSRFINPAETEVFRGLFIERMPQTIARINAQVAMGNQLVDLIVDFINKNHSVVDAIGWAWKDTLRLGALSLATGVLGLGAAGIALAALGAVIAPPIAMTVAGLTVATGTSLPTVAATANKLYSDARTRENMVERKEVLDEVVSSEQEIIKYLDRIREDSTWPDSCQHIKEQLDRIKTALDRVRNLDRQEQEGRAGAAAAVDHGDAE